MKLVEVVTTRQWFMKQKAIAIQDSWYSSLSELSAPKRPITLIQLRTPVMFCSFMLSYESNNYRSSQLSVRYSSGNCYLPWLVLPLPNTLSTSSTCMFQFVLVSGFPNNFIIQVSRILKKHFYTLEKA